MREKQRVLGGGEWKTKLLRGKESVDTIVSLKIELTRLYL